MDSIQRNLQNALPEMIGQLRNAPEDLPATFKLYRNLDALYDVLGSVVESTGAFGSKDDFQALANDLSSFEGTRKQIGGAHGKPGIVEGAGDYASAHGIEDGAGGDSGRASEENRGGRYRAGEEACGEEEASGEEAGDDRVAGSNRRRHRILRRRRLSRSTASGSGTDPNRNL